MYAVSDIFHSIQGEGPYAGRSATFIRLWGCNLRCKFCDTKYSFVSTEQPTMMTVEEIMERIKDFDSRVIVLTGGEPLVQDIYDLVGFLAYRGLKRNEILIVETNGTITPEDKVERIVDVWSVSPKLSNSGRKTKISDFYVNRRNAYLKFVIGSRRDLEEMEEYIKENNLTSYVDEGNVYLMPMCTTPEEHNRILPLLFDYIKEKPQYKITPRLHILAYGNQRGV